MKTKKTATDWKDRTHESVSKKARARSIEGGAVSGAVVGAAAGVFAGPAGALTGGVVGSIAGAVVGAVISDDADRRDARTSEVDREIGVIDGDIGEPSLRHPPDSAVAYFAAKEGIGKVDVVGRLYSHTTRGFSAYQLGTLSA